MISASRVRRLWFAGLPLLAGSALLGIGGMASGQTPATRERILTPQEWRGDLRDFGTFLKARHAAPFHLISRATFDRRLAALGRDVPTLSRDQIFVRLDRIANGIGDGHTYIRVPSDAPVLPVRFARFGGDYRIVGTDAAHAALLGARFSGIGTTPVKAVIANLLSLTPAGENAPLRAERVVDLLDNGMILHGSGISSSRSSVRYALVGDDGRRADVTIAANANTIDHWLTPALAASNNPASPAILCKQVGGDTVDCNFHSYAHLAEAAQAMFAFVDRLHPTRLILDLRDNKGGDYCEGLTNVVLPLRDRPDLNRKGALFVLIGPKTFSAALANAAHFRQLTKALLVGEPIGEQPNSYQEAVDHPLPRSGWVARASTRSYRFVDTRMNVIEPDKTIARTWLDFRAGRDRAADWIMRTPAAQLPYRPNPAPPGTEPLESATCRS